MNIALEHCDHINERFLVLTRRQQILFLCSTCERQFPVYAQFSEEKTWGNTSGLRQLLNRCWDWSISLGTASKPNIPASSDFVEVSGGQSGSGHAAYPYYSIDYLVQHINGSFEGNAAHPAVNAINIIDAFLYDAVFTKVTKENDFIINSSPLMTREIERQNQDMENVSRDDWQSLDWVDLKRSNIGLSVLTP